MTTDGAIDLPDLSVVIPFRCDSPSRLENLAAVMRYFAERTVNADIILIENGAERRADRYAAMPGARYLHEPGAGVFFRTRMLNRAVEKLSDRRFVAIYDADVLCYPRALRGAMEALRAGAPATLPYDGHFVDVSGGTRAALIAGLDFSALPPRDLTGPKRRYSRDVYCTNRRSVGGAPMFNRAELIACGGYNENFISWGPEDKEVMERLARLGRPLTRIEGYPLLHLAHARGPDSSEKNPWFRSNEDAYRRISALDRAELEKLVARGGLRLEGEPSPPPPSANRASALFRRLLGRG